MESFKNPFLRIREQVYNKVQEAGNMKRWGVIQPSAPRAEECEPFLESLTTGLPVPALWIDRQPALLELFDRANQLAFAASQPELLRQALRLILEAAQAESAFYFRLDRETDELVVSAVEGEEQSQHLLGLRFKRREGLLDAILSGSQTAIMGDLPSEPGWLRAAQPETASRIRNVIGLNLETPQRMLGVVQLYNYNNPEMDWLSMLCNRLAIEIDRWETLEGLRRSNQRLYALIDTIRQVSGTLDRSQLLRLVTEHASELVDAERSSVFLVDPATKEMMFQVAYQSPEQQGGKRDLYPAASDRQARPARPETHSSGEFKFFSRSAITVPITTGPRSQSQGDPTRHTLGGLMALSKRDDSFQAEDQEMLEILADQTSAFLQVAEMFETTDELMLDAIKALVAAIDAKDPYTQGHSHRVSDYSVMIAEELGLNEAQVYEVRIGSLLHDVGKIGIADAILKKEGKLTNEEFEEIKKHTLTGVNILGQVKMLERMLPAILEHHERLDGSGYPYGLQEHQISLMGRIVAVADVFDAMTSDRPYRKALSVSEVLDYLKQKTAILFDGGCVRALEWIIERAEDVR